MALAGGSYVGVSTRLRIHSLVSTSAGTRDRQLIRSDTEQLVDKQAETPPTLWGLTVPQIHDRFWAARGVQVVRFGDQADLVDEADLYMLLDPRALVLCHLNPIVEVLSWERPDVVFVRLHGRGQNGYRERVIAGRDDALIRIERQYVESDWRLTRLALTDDPQLAAFWQQAEVAGKAWRQLRRMIPRVHRRAMSINGRVYGEHVQEQQDFMHDLMGIWKSPDSTIERVRSFGESNWRDMESAEEMGRVAVGPVWIGAHRGVEKGEAAVGPAVLWDEPTRRPEPGDVPWRDIEPSPDAGRALSRKPKRPSSLLQIYRRCFDVVFALLALALTLPFYPIVMLLIWLEDRRPFFYVARRETLGGREFGCIKFRSMRRDADRIKLDLMAGNQADGPQFFMEDDPRVTRMGRWMRKVDVDEWPQFINVLKGDMSIVGPRPSPRRENQYCPQWREARLSVRPGITGLWQIKRSRRQGLDFQEWIRYDLEYVSKAGPLTDLYIIFKTIGLVLGKVLRI